MPTSSQALILFQTDGADKSSSRLALSRRSSAEVFPCHVSKLNMNDYFLLCKLPLEGSRSKSQQGTSSTSTAKQDHSKYRSILTYDTESESFQWKLVAGLNAQRVIKKADGAGKKDADENTEQLHVKGRGSPASSRPSSAKSKDLSSKFSLFSVNSKVYERLMGLGFRPRDVENGGQKETRRSPLQSAGVSSCPELKGWSKEEDKSFGFVDRVEVLHLDESITASKLERLDVDSSSSDSGKAEKELDESTVQSLIDDLKQQLGFDKRIKPSIHMRKRKPKERPLTVVLSLRDNDDFTHEEVKSIVEIKGSVKVKELQYDPLPVRAHDPDMTSRWYVTLSSKEEAEKLVKKGFLVGEDKIIVYSFDEVMRREVATYKFYEEVRDDHKRLKRKRSSGLRLK